MTTAADPLALLPITLRNRLVAGVGRQLVARCGDAGPGPLGFLRWECRD